MATGIVTDHCINPGLGALPGPRSRLATRASREILPLAYQVLDIVDALESAAPNARQRAVLRACASRVCTLGQVAVDCLAETEESKPLDDLAREVTHGC